MNQRDDWRRDIYLETKEDGVSPRYQYGIPQQLVLPFLEPSDGYIKWLVKYELTTSDKITYRRFRYERQ